MLAILMASRIEAAEVSNAASPTWWENEKSTVWSGQTNGLRTGIAWTPDSPVQKVFVLLFSNTAASPSEYVYPPGHRLAKVELRALDGSVVPPGTQSSKLDGDLPQSITAGDLPSVRSGSIFRGRGIDHEYFLLSRSGPSRLLDFKLTEIFEVKKRGDYTLTVCPVLYHFTTNRQSAIRVNWPC